MAIYTKNFNGTLYISNSEKVIDILTEKEYNELMARQNVWWRVILNKYFKK